MPPERVFAREKVAAVLAKSDCLRMRLPVFAVLLKAFLITEARLQAQSALQLADGPARQDIRRNLQEAPVRHTEILKWSLSLSPLSPPFPLLESACSTLVV
jgi:hypothetical protein